MAIPNMWRTKKQRYSLQGDVCVHCESTVFPPRAVCPHCHKPMHSQPLVAMPSQSHFAFAAASVQPALQAVVGDD